MKEKLDKTTKKQVKTHLRAMSKNSKPHRTRTTGRIAKYGAISFARNIWLSIAATLVMTITLLILLVTVVASVILSSTADAMRAKIDITIYLKPETTTADLQTMKQTLEADSNVRSVEIADAATEYARLLSERSDNKNLMNTLGNDEMEADVLSIMPATIRVKIYDPDNLDSIKHIVETDKLFKANLSEDKIPTYDVKHTEIETITSWANVAKNGGIILGAVFIAISILVIFNTIRMAIFSRREEIYMMKLVGADTNFIRGPFIVEAQLCGLISGLIASTIGYFGFRFIAPQLANYGIDVSFITEALSSEWLVVVFAVMIGIGVIIGTVSARLAIRKYLHKF